MFTLGGELLGGDVILILLRCLLLLRCFVLSAGDWNSETVAWWKSGGDDDGSSELAIIKSATLSITYTVCIVIGFIHIDASLSTRRCIWLGKIELIHMFHMPMNRMRGPSHLLATQRCRNVHSYNNQHSVTRCTWWKYDRVANSSESMLK